MQDSRAVEALSRDRLDGYAIKGGPNSDHDLLGRYLFNMAVSQALHPFFNTIEVILRNRVHNAVSQERPIDPDRPDLYDQFPCWLDERESILIADHQKAVSEAKRGVIRDLTRRHGWSAGAAKRFRTPGRLVAKLPFSFWVFLFDEEYSSTGRGNPGVLWPRYFEAVFRTRDGAGGIALVRKRLRRLLVVRNRIMHYERIAPWTDHKSEVLDPNRIREEILELLAWMEPRAEAGLRVHGSWEEAFSPEYQRYLQWVARRI